MFYVLCFSPRTFFTCDKVSDVHKKVNELLNSGTKKTDIVIVNCYPEGIQLDVDEFNAEFGEAD